MIDEALPALPINDGADTPDVEKAHAVRNSAALIIVPITAQNPTFPENLVFPLCPQPFID